MTRRQEGRSGYAMSDLSVGTLNVRSLLPRLPARVRIMTTLGIGKLAIQEARVAPAQTTNVRSLLRKEGLLLLLSNEIHWSHLDNHLTALVSRHERMQLRPGGDQLGGRCVIGALRRRGRPPLGLCSVYGPASNCGAAGTLAEDVSGYMNGEFAEWVSLGDYNHCADDPELRRLRQSGVARFMDEGFNSTEKPTMDRGRRAGAIDFGMCSSNVQVTDRFVGEGVADHDLVGYRLKNIVERGDVAHYRRPPRAFIDTEGPQIEDLHFNDDEFDRSIGRDVDEAWKMLSDAA